MAECTRIFNLLSFDGIGCIAVFVDIVCKKDSQTVFVYFIQLQYATAQDVRLNCTQTKTKIKNKMLFAAFASPGAEILCSTNCMRRAHCLRALIILYVVASICLQSHISTFTPSSI